MVQTIQLNNPAVIRLTPKKKEKRKFGLFDVLFPFPTGPKLRLGVKVLTSPVLTGGLAAGITALTTGSPFATIKTFGLVTTGATILKESPKALKFVKEKITDPTKAGRVIAEIIEDPSGILPKEKTLKEKIVTGAKAAGLIGAGAAAAVGIQQAVKKIKEIKVPKDIALPTFQPAQVSPVQVAPTLQEIPGEIKPVTEKPQELAAMPSIENTFNPVINIKIKNTGIKKTFKRDILLCCP